MKKIIYLILALPVVLLASCKEKENEIQKEQLATPEITVAAQTDSSFTIEWKSVEGADFYNYACSWSDEADSTSGTSLSFSGLEAGIAYTVTMTAVPVDPELYIESEPASVTVTLEQAEIKNGFTIELEEDSARRLVTVTITPDDQEMLYYREAFDDYYYEDLGGNPEDVWANALQSYIDMFGSPENVLMMVASRGVDEFQYEYVYDEHTYILVAGIDSSLNRITPIVDTMKYSGPVPPSDITFEVKVEEITTTSAVVYVTPSNNDPWSMLLIENSTLSEYSEDELKELIKVTYAGYINDGRVYNGAIDMTYSEGKLEPDTEYAVLTFGWNTTLSTEISRYVFKTLPASSSENLTFEWEVEILGPTDIHVIVTPSDMEARYIVLPLTMEEYEMYGDDIEGYIEYVTWGMLSTYEYASMWNVTGVDDEYFNEDYIYPDTSYKLLAVGVDIDNEAETADFYSPQYYENTVTTPAE